MIAEAGLAAFSRTDDCRLHWWEWLPVAPYPACAPFETAPRVRLPAEDYQL